MLRGIRELGRVLFTGYSRWRGDNDVPHRTGKSCRGTGRAPCVTTDPFDRLLIAQALAEGLDFVTNDEPIRQYTVRTIW